MRPEVDRIDYWDHGAETEAALDFVALEEDMEVSRDVKLGGLGNMVIRLEKGVRNSPAKGSHVEGTCN